MQKILKKMLIVVLVVAMVMGTSATMAFAESLSEVETETETMAVQEDIPEETEGKENLMSEKTAGEIITDEPDAEETYSVEATTQELETTVEERNDVNTEETEGTDFDEQKQTDDVNEEIEEVPVEQNDTEKNMQETEQTVEENTELIEKDATKEEVTEDDQILHTEAESSVTWSFNEKTGVLTISGTGAMDNYSKDGAPWFQQLEQIKSVVINKGITSIGDYAFCDYSEITKVSISNSVTSIGDDAFKWCSGLTEIEIPGSVTSIGDLAFCGCSGLTEIKIPNGVKSIGESVFCNCDGLKKVEIPASVTSIEDSAFEWCGNLTKISISDGVRSIGDYAFAYCYGLTGIEIPPSVTSIGDSAFWLCNKITEIKIPSSVRTIGGCAFECCYRLTTIKISESTTSIGEDAFRSCYELKDVYYSGTKSDFRKINIGSGNDHLTSATWHYSSCNHATSYHKAQAATCTKAGNIEYWYCKTCKKYFADKSSTVEITKASTVIAAGHKYYNHVCKSCKAVETLSTPKLGTITPSTSYIKVTWGKVSGMTKYDKYEVFRKVYGAKKWTSLGTTTKTYYFDKTAKTGTAYTYTVKCINKSGVVISKYNTTGVSSMILAAPVITARPYSSYIKVSWKKVTNASGYRVYRKAGSSKTFKAIATINGTTTYYKDTTTKSGVEYTYYVRAYSKKTGKTIWSSASKNSPIIVR